MRNFFDKAMRETPYFLFCFSIVFFIFSILFLILSFFNGPSFHAPKLFVFSYGAGYMAAVFFILASLLYRIDKWLEKSR